jgi:hypothetical protein
MSKCSRLLGDAGAQEQCDGMMRVRNFLVDELSLANLQLQDVHALHAQVCDLNMMCPQQQRP